MRRPVEHTVQRGSRPAGWPDQPGGTDGRHPASIPDWLPGSWQCAAGPLSSWALREHWPGCLSSTSLFVTVSDLRGTLFSLAATRVLRLAVLPWWRPGQRWFACRCSGSGCALPGERITWLRWPGHGRPGLLRLLSFQLPLSVAGAGAAGRLDLADEIGEEAEQAGGQVKHVADQRPTPVVRHRRRYPRPPRRHARRRCHPRGRRSRNHRSRRSRRRDTSVRGEAGGSEPRAARNP